MRQALDDGLALVTEASLMSDEEMAWRAKADAEGLVPHDSHDIAADAAPCRGLAPRHAPRPDRQAGCAAGCARHRCGEITDVARHVSVRKRNDVAGCADERAAERRS